MAIFGKASKAHSIFELKCPRCHEGEMFETGSWSFKKSFDMNSRCDRCNLNYYPEPGFYQGAMYVSYIWTGWFCVLFVLFFHWELGFSIDASFLMLLPLLALNFVYIFRISRLMWANLNIHYDPKAVEKFGTKPVAVEAA